MVSNDLKLSVLHDANASFTNYSNESHDYSRDTATITLTTTTGFIYIGFKKPINSLYIDFTTANTNAATTTLEYWNGTTWTAVGNLMDDSKGLTRSGFITWDRQTLANVDVQKAVNSITKNWVRLSLSATTSAMVINGISNILADDQDLKQEVPEIADTNHLAGKTSHILTHVAVRNQIIQDLRNKNYNVTNPTTGLVEDLTLWDILDINQLKQAAIFLALSKIYYNFSDRIDDIYGVKSIYYKDQYKAAIALSKLSLDSYSDGVANSAETQKPFSISRIVR